MHHKRGIITIFLAQATHSTNQGQILLFKAVGTWDYSQNPSPQPNFRKLLATVITIQGLLKTCVGKDAGQRALFPSIGPWRRGLGNLPCDLVLCCLLSCGRNWKKRFCKYHSCLALQSARNSKAYLWLHPLYLTEPDCQNLIPVKSQYG